MTAKKAAAAKKATKKSPTKAASRTAATPEPSPAPADTVRPGAVVTRSYFDPYSGAGGVEVTEVGIVTSVADGKARVAFLTPSHPIDVDELKVT